MSLFNLFSCCFPSRPKYYKWQWNQKIFLLDMPDVVTMEILKNLDFESIRKLRKVCHAFRDFIDCVKPDSNLKSIDLRVIRDVIIIFTKIPATHSSTKDIEIYYAEDVLFAIKRSSKVRSYQIDSFDSCIDDFLWPALKHQKSLLGELSVINRLDYYNKLKDVQTFEKWFDRLVNVLESRDCLLKVESLMISVNGQDQLMQLLRHINLKMLKHLEVFRVLEAGQLLDDRENFSEFVLDLGILKDCKNLESLHVRRFSISSPFEFLTHIPDLEVNMQTIYCEELLLFKQTMENSDINAHSEIHFVQFPDKSRFMENIGLVDDGSESFHVFPSNLSLTYDPALRCMAFG